MAGASQRPPIAMPGMRIGLLGGTFDPPHQGHRAISEMALARLGLDRVWWIVTPGNPLKSRQAQSDFRQRLRLARDHARHPRIDVTDFEAAHPDAFTVHTLAFLKRRFSGTRFVWLMGADNLADFHRWRCWRRIFRMLPIAVFDRPGYRLPACASPAGRSFAACRVDERAGPRLACLQPPVWTLLTIPLSPVSSTALRAAAREETVSAPACARVVTGY